MGQICHDSLQYMVAKPNTLPKAKIGDTNYRILVQDQDSKSNNYPHTAYVGLISKYGLTKP